MCQLAGCATAVTSIRDESEAALSQGEGFLLIEVDTSHDLESISIKGTKSVFLTRADLRAGSNYILVNLPAGEYRIERVDLNWFYYRMVDGMWDFAVEKDTISYVGNLTFKGGDWGKQGRFVLVNRSSFALEYLEEQFPNLAATQRLVYRGPGEDRFLPMVTGR
mgnify:CR=1 FL=1